MDPPKARGVAPAAARVRTCPAVKVTLELTRRFYIKIPQNPEKCRRKLEN